MNLVVKEMSRDKLDDVKEVVLHALSTLLSTYPSFLTVSIKKFSTEQSGGYSISGSYKKQEFLEEETGTFSVELTGDLEIENIEIF
jgi:hypothetical protein